MAAASCTTLLFTTLQCDTIVALGSCIVWGTPSDEQSIARAITFAVGSVAFRRASLTANSTAPLISPSRKFSHTLGGPCYNDGAVDEPLGQGSVNSLGAKPVCFPKNFLVQAVISDPTGPRGWDRDFGGGPTMHLLGPIVRNVLPRLHPGAPYWHRRHGGRRGQVSGSRGRRSRRRDMRRRHGLLAPPGSRARQ